MSQIRELYQEVIFDHYRHPHNCRDIDDANRAAQGHNPLCGDRLTLALHIENDVVTDVGFRGDGCAIATASASLMTDAIKGMNVEQVKKLFERFHHMVTAQQGGSEAEAASLGKLAVLAGVRGYPSRVKCATLPWRTLCAALERDGKVTTSEMDAL